MAKITLDPMVGSYASVTALNSRFQQIEDALNDGVLWRTNPLGETNTLNNDLDLNGHSLLNVTAISSTNLYLGAYATDPTESSPGVPLGAADEGKIYFNTTSNVIRVYDGSTWADITTGASAANAVSLTDAGGHYDATNVEAALAELASTTAGQGASIIGINDTGGYLTATDVEGALQELAAATGGASGVRYNLIDNGLMKVSQKSAHSFNNTSNVAEGTAGRWSYQDRWAMYHRHAGRASTWSIGESDVGFGDPPWSTIGDKSPRALIVSVYQNDVNPPASGDVSGVFQNLRPVSVERAVKENYLTLSFWVASSVTGTYCVALAMRGASGVGWMIKEYTISTADTWEKKTLVFDMASFPGGSDNAQTEDFSYENRLWFSLQQGPTSYEGAADTWHTSRKLATTSQTDLFTQATGSSWGIVGVQLEGGNIATDFIVEDAQEEYNISTCSMQIAGPENVAEGYATSTTAAWFAGRPPVKPFQYTIATSEWEQYGAAQPVQNGLAYTTFSGATFNLRSSGYWDVSCTGASNPLTVGVPTYLKTRFLIHNEYLYI